MSQLKNGGKNGSGPCETKHSLQYYIYEDIIIQITELYCEQIEVLDADTGAKMCMDSAVACHT